MARTAQADAHRERIVELLGLSKGNLVRVHEELAKEGAAYSYQALTAFCRRHGIGHEPKAPVGRYEYEPGGEMQHDTSPHTVELAGTKVLVQTASLVLPWSRMLYFQHFLSFDRFACKVFFTDALQYLGGAAAVCVIDNSHVIVRRGSGANMEPAEEMAAFCERFDFEFAAHELGDPDGKAGVERNFWFIETNFLANRPAVDLADLNRQAVQWCDKVNGTFKPKVRAVPRELFATERRHLRPLPGWVPEVYRVHNRIVDVEGYVSVHSHRYSAPWRLIGRQLEVRESKDEITLFDGPRIVATHRRVLGQTPARVTQPDHRPPRGHSRPKDPPEQEELARIAPTVADYLVLLRAKFPGRAIPASRRLLRMVRDYPRGPLLAAVRIASEHGLFDLDRLDRMVLRCVAADFFPVPHRKKESR